MVPSFKKSLHFKNWWKLKCHLTRHINHWVLVILRAYRIVNGQIHVLATLCHVPGNVDAWFRVILQEQMYHNRHSSPLCSIKNRFPKLLAFQTHISWFIVPIFLMLPILTHKEIKKKSPPVTQHTLYNITMLKYYRWILQNHKYSLVCFVLASLSYLLSSVLFWNFI